MKMGLRFAVATFVMLVMSGCATTIGKPYDANKMSSFVVGQTTVDQVVAALGEPMERETESDGSVRLHYEYSEGKATAATYVPVVNLFSHGASVKGVSTFIYFDRSGHYVRYESTSTNTEA
jgi:hypothetical protein